MHDDPGVRNGARGLVCDSLQVPGKFVGLHMAGSSVFLY